MESYHINNSKIPVSSHFNISKVDIHLKIGGAFTNQGQLTLVLGKLPGGGNGNPLQFSCLENPTHRGAWQGTVHSVAKSQTGLSRHAQSLYSSTLFNMSPLAFELWCWRKPLRVHWTKRRSNESILKKINPDYSLEGLMLKLKLWYFGHLMWITDSLEKTLMLGNKEGRRRSQKRKKWLDGVTDSMNMSLSKVQEILKDKEDWCAAVHGVTKIWTQLSDWTTTCMRVFKKGKLLLTLLNASLKFF